MASFSSHILYWLKLYAIKNLVDVNRFFFVDWNIDRNIFEMTEKKVAMWIWSLNSDLCNSDNGIMFSMRFDIDAQSVPMDVQMEFTEVWSDLDLKANSIKNSSGILQRASL